MSRRIVISLPLPKDIGLSQEQADALKEMVINALDKVTDFRMGDQELDVVHLLATIEDCLPE